MKVVYLTEADVDFIYSDLKSQGYYEWYITLKCIEEIQCDYTFFSKITWSELLNNEIIYDISGRKPKGYTVNDELKAEILVVMDKLDIDNIDENIVKTEVKELYQHLLTYDSIKLYKQHTRFRVDFFKDYTVDVNGVRTYALRTVKAEDDKFEFDLDTRYFLYIAQFADKKEDDRLEQFKFKFWDKKIGIAKVVGRRMDELSKDKRHGGTHSPLYVKALRAWYMPTKLCRSLEREFHDFYDQRNTGGEWYTDYEEDIIPYVDKRIKKLIKEGKKIIKIDITKENEDVTFIEKVGKAFWDKVPEEFVERVKYEI